MRPASVRISSGVESTLPSWTRKQPPLLHGALTLLRRGDAYERLAASLELDDQHLRRTLGWQPFWSQEDGLRLTAEWFNASADLTNGTS
jgi:nucleoside-diphosphate-sugar epimerase